MLKIDYIGRTNNIPDWPEVGTIAGLLDALGRWKLDEGLNLSNEMCFEPCPERKPYRALARRFAGEKWNEAKQCNVYLVGDLMYPDCPGTISYLLNFERYSFACGLVTDEPELIAQLDAAIAKNMATWPPTGKSRNLWREARR